MTTAEENKMKQGIFDNIFGEATEAKPCGRPPALFNHTPSSFALKHTQPNLPYIWPQKSDYQFGCMNYLSNYSKGVYRKA